MEHTGGYFRDFIRINPQLPENFMLLLGSRSPRRHEIIRRMDIPYKVVDIPFDESKANTREPLALAKAKNLAYTQALLPGEMLLTADTVVRVDGRILGKPRTEAQAREMLRLLSGREHTVETGVCLRTAEKTNCFSEITRITFKTLHPAEIDYYIRRYRPFDKAGAYGIQEWIGLTGIVSIQGDYYNVMGLPAAKTWKAIMGQT